MERSDKQGFLNPAQLERFSELFEQEILPALKAHEEEVERNPELKAHLVKQAKRQDVHHVFQHMMAEVEVAIEKPGTPFAEKLKSYIDDLEGIVNAS